MKNRKTFWTDFENKDFDYIAKKYGGMGTINKVKRLLRKIKRKLVR